MVMIMRMGMAMVMVVIMVMRVMVIMIMVVVMRMVMMAVVMAVRMVRLLLPAQQTQADQHDQRITDNLDDANSVTHRFCRRAEKCRGNTDNGNSGECLQDRRCKRQHNSTTPGFVIRDQVR